MDKYEHRALQHVINEDILAYESDKKYDLIVSISTLEHIGWDEQPKLPEKVLQFPEKVLSLLRSDGEVLVTIPVGFNPFLDNAMKEGRMGFAEISCLKRISASNEWHSTDLDSALRCAYNTPFTDANSIVIGTFRKTTAMS